MLGFDRNYLSQTCTSEPKAELLAKMIVIHFIASRVTCDFA